MNGRRILLEVNDLKKHFPVRGGGLGRRAMGRVKAVDGVSFRIFEGETLGLVGESGCGKTTLGRCVVRGISATSGAVLYHGSDGQAVDFLKLDGRDLRRRRQEIQMIFQDPHSSLDPRMSVYDIIAEPLRVNGPGTGRGIDERVKYLAGVVSLNISHLMRYPHAFSGGQRQRIGIARALATNPRLVVADEPVSALDVSVRAQVLNLLEDLQEEFSLTYLFVSHDLSVVKHIADRVAVMYVGRIVEISETDRIFDGPKHPYTEALLSAVPRPDPRSRMKRIVLEGDVPNPADPPSGCHFHPRCRYARDICRERAPALREVEPGHLAACHFAGDLELRGVSAIR
ncbi:MAG: ATP-binding cassette domain-containing protein [Spirochaetes bacterium]|nr:ATP-binding cassette domain-containing protein [Spirochaetota bacterium]